MPDVMPSQNGDVDAGRKSIPLIDGKTAVKSLNMKNKSMIMPDVIPPKYVGQERGREG